MPRASCTQRFIERRRAEIVVFIVLPISLIIWLVRKLKRRLFAPAPHLHAERVAKVAECVAANSRGGGKLLRTDRSVHESHSVRNSDKTRTQQAPLRDLRAILDMQHSDMQHGGGVLHVEPGATVGEVTSYLLRQTPPLQLECCLEMEDATLGGLAMAQGMTTHSHMCGLLCETGEAGEAGEAGERERRMWRLHIARERRLGKMPRQERRLTLLWKLWVIVSCTFLLTHLRPYGARPHPSTIQHPPLVPTWFPPGPPVTEYELVVGSGEVVVATAGGEHDALFRALPLSHGSLGLLVSLKLRVVPARQWVEMRYAH